MKIAMVAFTANGTLLEKKIQSCLQKQGHEVLACTIARYAESYDMIPLEKGLDEWTKNLFGITDAFVFIGAAGIAVRAVAPLLQSKDTDPAVLVVDETGRFVVPLLSGHIGGANRLAQNLADELGARAVITTASDVRGVFAADTWASEHGLAIPDIRQIKHVTAALLEAKQTGFYSDFPTEGQLPKGLNFIDSINTDNYPTGIAISVRKNNGPFEYTLALVPRILSIGIGCRRGIPCRELRNAVSAVLEEYELYREAVCNIASVDLKADEMGLIELAETMQVPFVTYSAEELNTLDGKFSASSFVNQTVGTDNVCERAAVKAAGNGMLIVKKQIKNGITIAIAQSKWKAVF